MENAAGWIRPRAWVLLLLLSPACGPAGEKGHDPAGPGLAPKVEETGPAFLNQSPDVAYVGSGACSTCHAEIALAFRKTGMGRSWYPMSRSVAMEDFTDHNELVIGKTGLHYRMLERDGHYYQRQFLVDDKGREFAVDEREMMQVVGSGNHSRLYITIRDGRFYQMPVAWYTADRLWDLAPGFQINNFFFSRQITPECTFCHNATMEPVEGTRNRYQEPVPAGIDCERCHGPGQLHVEKWTDPGSESQPGTDLTIVNPKRLSRSRRIQICYQCHLGGSETAERPARNGRSRYEYRPGASLLDVMVPNGYEEPDPSKFNVTGQADRMILSRCYSGSGGRLECLTCHNPHVSVYHAELPADYYRQKCLGCHRTDQCRGPDAMRQATEPIDDCVSCHMRRAEPSDHGHAVFIDHWIRKRIDIDPSHEQKSFRFVPILAETAQVLTPGEIELYRGRTGLLKSFQTTEPARQFTLRREADASFRAALKEGLDTADAWYFLGKNLMYFPRYKEAAEAFTKALERDPGHRDARFELASALLNLNQPARAAGLFQEMLKANPRDPAALADLGRCQLTLGRPEEALRLFDRALQEDPGKASLYANRGAALAALGRSQEAAGAAGQAARLDPGNSPIWQFYADLLGKIRRREEEQAARRHLAELNPAG
ncbi:MAG: tetratricopeptide repeat protein [Acidobacteriota bacterium]